MWEISAVIYNVQLETTLGTLQIILNIKGRNSHRSIFSDVLRELNVKVREGKMFRV